MKYIRGFLMAWGMFCWIPCPYKGWREEDRKAQLAMFPLVGTFIGIILGLVWWGLSLIGAGNMVAGALLTGAYFLLTGFIHLDGFMDCSDAIMPRHPDMETRRRILKDSHSGAFALISVALMFLIFAGSMMELADSFSLGNCCLLVLIFTASRLVCAVSVMVCQPMSTSQYKSHQGRPADTVPAFIAVILVGAAATLLAVKTGQAAGNPDFWYGWIIPVAVTVLVAAIVGANDRNKLGGMNGDISGHMLTMSEMFAVAAMAIVI